MYQLYGLLEFQELLKHLSTWAKDNNKIVIAVLHDLNLVHYFSDEKIKKYVYNKNKVCYSYLNSKYLENYEM